MKLFAATSLCLAIAALGSASAQTCTPELVGLETGPYKTTSQTYGTIFDMMPFTDASGPSLILAGGLFVPDPHDPQLAQGALLVAGVARYQDGHWSVMRSNPDWQESGLALAQADFSSLGGPDRSIYALFRQNASAGTVRRWDGGNWVAVGAVPLSTGVSLLSHTDEQGPVLLLGGSSPQAVYAWRGAGVWTPYAPFTLSFGTVRRLRLVDDGSGAAVFAMGTLRDTSRNLNALVKLVDGTWTQYDLPPAALAAGNVTDIATFDDGASVNGPDVYIAWQTTAGCSVARRRNGAWETIAEGFASDPSNPAGASLMVTDVAGVPHLYFSSATTFREWTASGWTVPFTTRYLSTLPAGAVRKVVNFDDGHGEQTYFGGSFTDFFEGTPYPGNSATPAFGLIRTSERGLTSMALGVGYATLDTGPRLTYLSSIELPEGPRLIVGGPINRAGGQYCNGAAIFDGANWFNFSASTQVFNELRAATVMTIDGQPRIVASRLASSDLFFWDGSSWQTFAPDPGVFATKFMTLNGTLYAGASPLKRFTGSSWETVATGFNTAVLADLGNGQRILLGTNNGVFEFDGTNLARVGPVCPPVWAIAVVNDGPGPRIYVYCPDLTNKIARLTESSWEELPPGVHNPISGTSLAIASFDDGHGPALYVTGHRYSTAVRGAIARWRDNAWSLPMAPAAIPSEGLDNPSMAVVGDRLYIQGNFSHIGNITADHLAWIQACPRTCDADFNGDGDWGTDADIEAFFLCLAGTCCPRCTADFNNDGDTGTDADIESFFRVLAGGPC